MKHTIQCNILETRNDIIVGSTDRWKEMIKSDCIISVIRDRQTTFDQNNINTPMVSPTFIYITIKNSMTKYRIDHIITGTYTGPLAKRHCAALRHALTMMWTVMMLPNALDAFRLNHFVLLVDWCAESGLNVELYGSDGTNDDYDDSSEADDEQPAASTVVLSSISTS